MPSPVPPDAPTPGAAPGAAAVRYRCRHVTRYAYGEPVTSSQLLAHLAPRPHPRQTVQGAALVLAPQPAVAVERLDWFGNPVTYAAVQTPHRDLTVTAELEVEVRAPAPSDPALTPAWEAVRDAAPALPETAEYLYASPRVPAPDEALAGFALPSFPEARPVALGCLDLMHRINADFAFDPTATTVSTPVRQVLAQRRGVCQDFAHLMIGALRALGLPARYVSGYLRTDPPQGAPSWRGAAAGHAWVQAWCGTADGWLDLDPTNDVTAGLDHVTLGWGRDYDDVCPLRGVILGGGMHTLTVEVRVEPLSAAG